LSHPLSKTPGAARWLRFSARVDVVHACLPPGTMCPQMGDSRSPQGFWTGPDGSNSWQLRTGEAPALAAVRAVPAPSCRWRRDLKPGQLLPGYDDHPGSGRAQAAVSPISCSSLTCRGVF
jgi:hypothetical protein